MSNKQQALVMFGDIDVHYDKWKKMIDLDTADYGKAGTEFLNGTLIDIDRELPIKTKKKYQWVKDTPESEPVRELVDWTVEDDKALPGLIRDHNARKRRLDDDREHLCNFIMHSITEQLRKDVLSKQDAEITAMVATRNTLGIVNILQVQSLELVSKSKNE
jgi:hypothetical protein